MTTPDPTATAASDSGVCVRCIKVGPFDPCCSSHDAPLCHRCYRLTHFVEVCGCRTCDAEGLPKIMGEHERTARLYRGWRRRLPRPRVLTEILRKRGIRA